MASQSTSTSFAEHDATDMLGSIIGQLSVGHNGEQPETGGNQQDEVSFPTPPDPIPAGPKFSKLLASLKHKLDHQNKYMVQLKRKIRENESVKSRTNFDHEELVFLRHRLEMEGRLQRKLLNELIIEQQKSGTDGSQWQSIRLCTDKIDDACANPWTMGSVPMDEGKQFSCDSIASQLSSNGEQSDGDGKFKQRLEKELLNRDRVIEILQGRLERLTVDVRKVRRDNDIILDKHPHVPVAPGPRFCETDMMRRLEFYRANTDTLGKNLEQMEQALQCIQKELGTMGGKRSEEAVTAAKECSNDHRSTIAEKPCESRRSSCTLDVEPTTERLHQCSKDLEAQKHFGLLLHEYTKKTTECRQLSERLAKAHAGPSEPSPEDTEREMLKKRCTELLDEQDEFRVLIREQATQLEDYRGKYLDAQQKAEEQRLQMDKLRITNKRVEAQINFEIEQIKRKFQDKLRELTPYPRLLEDEEAKSEQLKQSNQTLYAELERVLKEVKSLEARLGSVHAAKDAEAKKAQQLSEVEVGQLTEQLKQLAKEKQDIEEKFVQAQRDLDEFRTESARIIARTNERLEQEQLSAKQKYAKLENELAQARAEASFTISNREEALREMHNQIRVLSGSFDDAQLQIRSLRNQLSYLQNEKLICTA